MRRDANIAGAVALEPWLDSLVASVCTTAGPITVPTYAFDDATVMIAKRTVGQEYPEIDITLRGQVQSAARGATAFAKTLVVAKRNGRWLVCGDRSDPRTSGCVTTA